MSRALERRLCARRLVENSVVFDVTRLLNTEGLRYSDECARHKVLDVVGVLALAALCSAPIARCARAHKLNHGLLTALMAIAAPGGDRGRNGPSFGALTLRSRRGMVGGMIAPAYAPTCPDFRLENVLTFVFGVSERQLEVF